MGVCGGGGVGGWVGGLDESWLEKYACLLVCLSSKHGTHPAGQQPPATARPPTRRLHAGAAAGAARGYMHPRQGACLSDNGRGAVCSLGHLPRDAADPGVLCMLCTLSMICLLGMLCMQWRAVCSPGHLPRDAADPGALCLLCLLCTLRTMCMPGLLRTRCCASLAPACPWCRLLL